MSQILTPSFVNQGIYTPFTYITGFASDNSAISPSIGPYLLPIINAASTFGRIGPAFVADEFGRFNTIIPCLLSTAVLIIAWPACTTTASVIVFAILFGFFSGVYVSLIPACASQLASTAVVGQILGLMFFFVGAHCLHVRNSTDWLRTFFSSAWDRMRPRTADLRSLATYWWRWQ